jgi:hypothetical protein
VDILFTSECVTGGFQSNQDRRVALTSMRGPLKELSRDYALHSHVDLMTIDIKASAASRHLSSHQEATRRVVNTEQVEALSSWGDCASRNQVMEHRDFDVD